jgi:membrane-associated protein
MDLLAAVIDFVLHIDRHLDAIVQQYGFWTYLILFLIIFCETGLVVTPVLPGDSLLFVIGTFAARGSLDFLWSILLLSLAAIAGDTVNYWVGYLAGPKMYETERIRWIKREYLERAHQFYEKYGGKTIILARFVPIVRTFAPFVAGIGTMHYSRFILYNVMGGISWIVLLVGGGYFFGNLPIVKNNFTFVIFAIIVLSVLPSVIEVLRQRRGARN